MNNIILRDRSGSQFEPSGHGTTGDALLMVVTRERHLSPSHGEIVDGAGKGVASLGRR
jgi:hypothetical protein